MTLTDWYIPKWFLQVLICFGTQNNFCFLVASVNKLVEKKKITNFHNFSESSLVDLFLCVRICLKRCFLPLIMFICKALLWLFMLLIVVHLLPSFHAYLWSRVVLVMITTTTYMFIFSISGLMIYHTSFLDMHLLVFALFSMQWGLDGKCIPSVYFQGFIHVH